MTATWKIEDAQNQFYKLIGEAIATGPQTIVRDGEALAIVVASNEWDEIQKKQSDTLVFNPLQTAGLKNFICG